MQMKSEWLALVGLVLMLGSRGLGVERHVPSEHATIQAAIDAASDGDEVIIAPGTYTGDGNRDLDFGGRAITVRSTDPNDPNAVAATVIQCNPDDPNDPDDPNYYGEHRGFHFHSGEDAGSVVAGLTIRSGYVAEGGGGIECESSSPTVTGCVLAGNRADWFGGALHSVLGSPTIHGCTIIGNSSSLGGGIAVPSGNPTITNCTISDNSSGMGGGITCFYGTITNCIISQNTSSGECAGVLCAWTTIANCTISSNSAADDAGGIACSVSTISNCTISSNAAGGLGGGVLVGGSPKADPNSLQTVLTNCLLWGNTASDGHDLTLHYSDWLGETLATVAYCNVQGGPNEVCVEPNCTLIWADGNIDADPCFVDPNGPDGDPNTWEDNDYHLSSNSPCIDAGDPNFVVDPNRPFDIDAEPRVRGGRVEMGSDEYWADHVVLTLEVKGQERGDVDLDPAPTATIDPRHWYPIDTPVTLTAEPASGKFWGGWEGDVDPNDEFTNPLTVVMDSDKQITTAFKCGLGTAPMLPMMLAVLGVFALIRRGRQRC